MTTEKEQEYIKEINHAWNLVEALNLLLKVNDDLYAMSSNRQVQEFRGYKRPISILWGLITF